MSSHVASHPPYLKTAYANQQVDGVPHGPCLPNGTLVVNHVKALPAIIWRGVALSQTDRLQTVDGLGLVPPAMYGKTSAQAQSAENAFVARNIRQQWSTHMKAIAHSLRGAQQNQADKFYTSWSRSWTTALHWAIAESGYSECRPQDREKLLQKTYLIAALPHRLRSDRLHDIAGLLSTPAWRHILTEELKAEKKGTEAVTVDREVETFIHNRVAEFDGLQEVVVLGAVPEMAYFSVTLWDLFRPDGAGARGVLGLPYDFLATAASSYGVLEHRKRSSLRMILQSAMHQTPEQLAGGIAQRWISCSRGRFRSAISSQLTAEQLAKLKAENIEIQEHLAHALSAFRLIEYTQRELAATLVNGEVCWCKDREDVI